MCTIGRAPRVRGAPAGSRLPGPRDRQPCGRPRHLADAGRRPERGSAGAASRGAGCRRREGADGDPSRASAELGRLIEQSIVTQTVDAIRRSLACVRPRPSGRAHDPCPRPKGRRLEDKARPVPMGEVRRPVRIPPRLVERRRALASVPPPGQRADHRAGRHGAGACACRPDRARDAPGGRPAESLQRGRRRQAQPRGGHGAAARVRAERQIQHRDGDRPGDPDRGRRVSGRHQPAARRAVLRSHDPLGNEQRRGSDGWEPHADRSDDRQAGSVDPGRRSLQHVLHVPTAGRPSSSRRL